MYSYPKRIRLRSRKDYLRLSESSLKFVSRSFVLLVAAGLKDTPRFGITVSKRVGNAVTRNRLKRYVREYIRQNLKNIRPSDFVIIARSPAASLPYNTICSDLNMLIAKFNKCSLES